MAASAQRTRRAIAALSLVGVLSTTACAPTTSGTATADTTTGTTGSSSVEASATTVAGAGQWQQLTFADPAYGDQELSYNLFLPADYDPDQEYPLVLFMEDASMVGTTVTTPVDQGEGATVWASGESQQENPAIVIAPRHTSVVVEDVTAQDADFDCTVLEAGTDLGQGAVMEHMGTWDYAYGIGGIRDWLFAQEKSDA